MYLSAQKNWALADGVKRTFTATLLKECVRLGKDGIQIVPLSGFHLLLSLGQKA